MRRRAATALLCLLLCACPRKHVRVDEVPELGYPACVSDGGTDLGPVVGRGHLRSGPSSQEQDVVERFELQRTACGYTLRARQEWPLDTSDVEVRYDAALTPIWAWKRMTLAATSRADGNADTRRYELRTGDVFIKRRDPNGERFLEKLLPGGRMRVPAGARVGAVVGPGRGVISAWLKREKLPVGGKTTELVLDFRSMIEVVEMGTLERSADQFEPTVGKSVRVYTFFGRETVFADESDVVIGNLAGMRPSDSLKTPEPPPVPTFGGADPAGTP